jgi:hypothetical protein
MLLPRSSPSMFPIRAKANFLRNPQGPVARSNADWQAVEFSVNIR